ncbi:DUF2309 domain-containing protein [Fulvivirga sp. M361]|nr:DUF2309 domain-containing protein [Fulvivirga sp. M361]
MNNLNNGQETLLSILKDACKKIAPVWPLENFVAVNPYLGLTDKKFGAVAHDLAAAGGIQMTLPASFYLQKFEEGVITTEDITRALNNQQHEVEVSAFINDIKHKNYNSEEIKAVATLADIATQVTNKDWGRFLTARVSVWAASYFDNGQALWTAADQTQGLFASWKAEAEVDRTPELTGLKGFRKLVKSIPDNPVEAIERALQTLNIPEEGLSLYLHRILLRVGGWSAYAARLDWENELYGGKDGKLIEFLAVLTCWEACLFKSLNNQNLNQEWNKARELLSLVNVQQELNQQLAQKLILQEAFDLAAQRSIVNKIQSKQQDAPPEVIQPKAQAIFCIDVRSEVYRRNLELVDPEIDTLGFAGFFAFPIKYVPIAHEDGEANCPVLLPTGPVIQERMNNPQEQEKTLNSRLFNRQVQQMWKSFKSGAVTCFSFVSPMGLSYLPKIFTDSFGITRPVPHPDKVGLNEESSKNRDISLAEEKINDQLVGIPLDQQIQMAKNALNAMSLTNDFAKYVLMVGHGSSTVNNPHATGYDCGACGGHTGEANAKVAAAVLNNKEVRAGLQNENIFIPVNTVFLACLHDTTTDDITIYNTYDVPLEKAKELQQLEQSLSLASHATRKERSLRLTHGKGSDIDKSIIRRSKDWSQTRPEWGLAGCSAFVVAPRDRTKGIDLGGRSFLHSYEWKKDKAFSVLELIMTAPMVVTSWISLQYYGSTVDNKNFGSGNKTLHNVTAGLGVLEGYSGDLRVGLPIQSVHDGDQFQHEPLKLNVIIEAPIDAMNTILVKHNGVRDLCDNGWLNLLAMDDQGKVSHRYVNDLRWEKIKE